MDSVYGIKRSVLRNKKLEKVCVIYGKGGRKTKKAV